MKIIQNILQKAKASKLWFAMAVLFIAILNATSAEARSLKKGEEFKQSNGGAIRVFSSDEVEIVSRDNSISLGKYTVDGERVRVVYGIGIVEYYKITPDGLVEEKGGKIYYSKAGLDAENSRQAALKAAIIAAKFIFIGDEVTDKKTGLIWRRCAEGMVYQGGTCTGANGKFTYEQALHHAADQASSTGKAWRVPAKDELASIFDGSYNSPKINLTAFPATPESTFWSASPVVNYPKNAWYVHFGYYDPYGGIGGSHRNSSYSVRLVRGGQNAGDKGANEKANVNESSKDSGATLIVAVESNNAETVKALLAKGANANVKNKNNLPVLIYAATKENAEVIKALLAKGADVNAKNSNGYTALSVAINKGNADIAKILLANGADVNAKLGDDMLPTLNFAASKGNGEIVKALLESGANPNAKDKNGNSALLFAAASKNTEIFKMMLGKGADVSIKNNIGATIFDVVSAFPEMQVILNNHVSQNKVVEDKAVDGSRKDTSAQVTEESRKGGVSGGRFTFTGDEVVDSNTGLIWRRCAEGMEYSGGTCIGTARTFTYEQALQHAKSEASRTGISWRLPNRDEFTRIIDKSYRNPAIEPTAFPATPSKAFWPLSPEVGFNVSLVDFGDDGYWYSSRRSDSAHVRLVRAGQ